MRAVVGASMAALAAASLLTGCGSSKAAASLPPVTLPKFQGCAAHTRSSSHDIRIPIQVLRPALGEAVVAVGVCIDGKGPYSFAVDTGASSTSIDTTAAKKAGLSTFLPSTSSNFGCSSQIALAQATTLSAGDLAIDGGVVVVGHIRSPQTPNIDGVLGADVLGRFGAARFDFAAGTLTLAGPEAAVPASRTGTGRVTLDRTMTAGTSTAVAASVSVHTSALPGGPDENLITARMTVPVTVGARPGRFVVDTGAARTVVAPGLAKAAALVAQKATATGYAGFDCKVDTTSYGVGPWSLPGRSLDPQVVWSDDLSGADGLLGAGTLQYYSPLVVDFRDAELLLGPFHTG